jgi:hypothetical protein
MKLFFAIYLLGSFISVFWTMLILKFKNKNLEKAMEKTEDLMSEKLSFYDSRKYMQLDIIIFSNFLLSWIIVIILLYAKCENFMYWLRKKFKNKTNKN